jgi:hypothetical protein
VHVEIDWSYTGAGDENLGFTRVLYAYLHAESNEVLYLGKADRCSVRERLRGAHKKAVFGAIAEVGQTNVLHAIVGVLYIEEGCSFISELLSDVESLLIINVQPSYNTQSRQSRIERPGLEVRCRGAWPMRRKVFRDA